MGKRKNKYKGSPYSMSSLSRFLRGNHEFRPQVFDTQVELPTSAIIYKSELEFLLNSILEYPNIETGGQLFGFWTAKGVPVVLYAIGPGPKAGHESAFFRQDIDYLQIVGSRIVSKYGLKHIGEWHSHHQLGLAEPSGHDASNMQNSINKNNLGRFLLCIGNCNSHRAQISPFNFVESSHYYMPSEWEIIDCDSPFRDKIDSELRDYINLPKHEHGMVNSQYQSQSSNRPSSYKDGYWLNNRENNLVLNSIKTFLEEENYGKTVKVVFDSNEKIIRIKIEWNSDEIEEIIFPQGFPECPPIITNYMFTISQERYDSITDNWYFNGNIFDSFKSYYQYFKNYGLA